MRLPIRNKTPKTLTIFIEITCDRFDVPVGGEAIIRLADGPPHSIDVAEGLVTIWDEDNSAAVEIVSESDRGIDDALRLAQVWLHRLGAEREAKLMGQSVDDREIALGYFNARVKVFGAFYLGFLNEEQGCSDQSHRRHASGDLEACYRAGVTAARLNRVARENKSFPELGAAPMDTDAVREAFRRAVAYIG